MFLWIRKKLKSKTEFYRLYKYNFKYINNIFKNKNVENQLIYSLLI